MNSEDYSLESTLKELLHNSRKLDSRDITVSVHDHDVTLSGTVKSQEERDYAEEILHNVDGVESVHIDLIVKTHPGLLPTDIGRNP